jgi:hypothetical protein
MIGHILKEHVSFDSVPFRCSLCLFRCQDKETLVDHIQKYKRHREAEAKEPRRPDYSKILKKSSHPVFVGDNDMVMLSKEESLRWHARLALTGDDLSEALDGLFEEEEDEDPLSTLPEWALPAKASRPTQDYIPTPIPQLASAFSEVRMPTPDRSLVLPQMQPQVYPSTQSAATETSTGPFMTINAGDLAEILGNTPPRSAPITKSAGSRLNTPTFPPQSESQQGTPCQDEHILPGLLFTDRDDPLYHEADQVRPTDQMPPVHDEPLPKKRRIEEAGQDVPDILSALSKAIGDGVAKLVDAIDRNTRAIRCQEKTQEGIVNALKSQEKTQEKIVNELARIERKINRLERSNENLDAHQAGATPLVERGQLNRTSKGAEKVKPASQKENRPSKK